MKLRDVPEDDVPEDDVPEGKVRVPAPHALKRTQNCINAVREVSGHVPDDERRCNCTLCWLYTGSLHAGC